MGRTVNVLAIAGLSDSEMKAIQDVDPGVVLKVSLSREETAKLVPEAEILLASGRIRVDYSRAQQLKWVHLTSAGVDPYFRCQHCQHQLVWDGSRLDLARPCTNPGGHEPLMALPGAEVIVTQSGGIAGVPITEYVYGALLFFARKFRTIDKAQAEHHWLRQDKIIASEIYGSTLGIVGFGRVGRSVARPAKAFGLKVLYYDAVAAPAELEAELGARRVGLDELMQQSDFVSVCTPLTADTEGLVGDSLIRQMKPTAMLINVARGRVVDEPALINALQEGRVAGAVLDVFHQEPLGPTSPLWDMPNVLMSPHIAGITDAYLKRAVPIFVENLGYYIAGKPMINVVDRIKGY